MGSEPISDGTLKVPFHRTLPGQAIASVGSGIFQVYSGGICIDTLKTRMQNGQTVRSAFWQTNLERTSALTLVKRYARRNGGSAAGAWAKLIARSNLYSGHFVTAIGRFPYLFLNLGTYSQAEQWLLRRSGDEGARPLSVLEDAFCITVAAITSSLSLTMTECPKVMDQLRRASGGGSVAQGRTTVASVIRQHGLLRVLQGYEASFLREVGFSIVFLGAPGIAARTLPLLGDSWVDENGSPGRAGLLMVSVPLGMWAGFMTNSVDELKTRARPPPPPPPPSFAAPALSEARGRDLCRDSIWSVPPPGRSYPVAGYAGQRHRETLREGGCLSVLLHRARLLRPELRSVRDRAADRADGE